MTALYVANTECRAITARVRVTTYSSEAKQTDSTPNIGAFNTFVGSGSVAVSDDLLERGFTPFSKIWIDGFGEFVVRDKMNSRIKNTIDIWIPHGGRHTTKNNVLAVRYCSGTMNALLYDSKELLPMYGWLK